VARLKVAAKVDGNQGRNACALAHDVSIPAGRGGALRGRQRPSKVSIISIWLPQQGQSRTGAAGASALVLAQSLFLDAGAAMAIRIRIVARLSAREPLARRP